MVPRVGLTQTRFPTNIIYTAMDNPPLYSMWHFRTDSLPAGDLFQSQHVCITISLFRSQSYFLFIVTLNCVSMQERERAKESCVILAVVSLLLHRLTMIGS